MTAVLALPVVVFGEPDPPAAEVVPSPNLVLSVSYPISDEGVTAASEEALDSETEKALTEEVEARATSTTTSTTTTTAPAPAPTNSDTTTTIAAAPPSKSSGSQTNSSGSQTNSSGSQTNSSGSQTSSPTTTQPKAAPTTTKAPAPPPSSGSYNSGMESDFHSRINSLRASNGKGGLSRSGSLDSYARSWAKWMGEHGELAHSGVGSLLPPWSTAGENVGRGGSVSGIFGALAGSSGHLSNMLGNFTHVGIGVWVDSGGTIWTAHVFAR